MKIPGMYTSAEFGSNHPDFRRLLRTALQTYVRGESRRLGLWVDGLEIDALTDLEKRPRVRGWAISISHCPLLGGFIAQPSRGPFGLDIEQASRVSPKVLGRVAAAATEKTLLESLAEKDRPYFWVAKEAAIKYFGNVQPDSQLHFGNVEITAITSSPKNFRASHGGIEARGILFEISHATKERIIAAICESTT